MSAFKYLGRGVLRRAAPAGPRVPAAGGGRPCPPGAEGPSGLGTAAHVTTQTLCQALCSGGSAPSETMARERWLDRHGRV